MNVRAAHNRLNGPANRAAILDHVLALGHIVHRHLVAQWNVAGHFDVCDKDAFKRHRAHFGPSPDVHDGDSHVVVGLV
jgi:hypothetical protein